MQKKIIKSSLILLFGGIVVKFLGMLIKIIMTRVVGVKGISYYMMILPTFSLFMSIGQLGVPVALSRMVAASDKNNSNLYYSVIPFVFIINIFLMIFLILTSSFISSNLLHNSQLRISLIAISLVLPFTSISSICKSYFVGKEMMHVPVISNIFENIIRLLFVLFILPNFLYLNISYVVFLIVISNVFSEGLSTFILLLFIPRNINFKFKFNFGYTKEVFKISFYNLMSNFISNISYFLEPIILTNIFLGLGYSNKYINLNYGIITGYILPILFIPTFFTSAISQAMLPSLTKDYNMNKYDELKKKIRLISLLLILFGFFIFIIYFLFGDKILHIIYNNSVGFNYLRTLAPVFIIYYLQAPLSISLQAMGMTKDLMNLSLISSLIRVISLSIFSLFRIGIYSFILSIILNIIINTFLLYRRVFYYLK